MKYLEQKYREAALDRIEAKAIRLINGINDTENRCFRLYLSTGWGVINTIAYILAELLVNHVLNLNEDLIVFTLAFSISYLILYSPSKKAVENSLRSEIENYKPLLLSLYQDMQRDVFLRKGYESIMLWLKEEKIVLHR